MQILHKNAFLVCQLLFSNLLWIATVAYY